PTKNSWVVGDFNGDGKSDMAWRLTGFSSWMVLYGNTGSYAWAMVDGETGFNADYHAQAVCVGDFNGDGKSDIAWRPGGWASWVADWGGNLTSPGNLADYDNRFYPY
ncbi:MAG TPA: VCBS repeat-containing protein, partial [Humisphaera sp.]|nr:VCBS repeat-containing protein [Humisphaera sp.]